MMDTETDISSSTVLEMDGPTYASKLPGTGVVYIHKIGYQDGAIAMREACFSDLEDRRNEHVTGTPIWMELDAAMRGIAGLPLPS